MVQCERVDGYVPNLILTEFFYLQWRQFGSRIAKLRLESIINSQLIIVNLSSQLISTVGKFKVKYPKLSLGDAILLTLSQDSNSTILTTESYITDIKKAKAIKLDF